MNAEAEVKYEINEDVATNLDKILKTKGFNLISQNFLRDYYLSKNKSELGGWDFTRLRKYDDGKTILTQKEWKSDAKGNKVRIEQEKEISVNEFEKLLAQTPTIELIEKNRKEYRGKVNDCELTIDFDKLSFNDKNYYFVEVERIVDIEDSSKVRAELSEWVKSNIDSSLDEEALSMLDFIDKLNKK